jgi:predicted permease
MLYRDLLVSWRTVWRSPGFAVSAALCLALAIASAVTVFALVRSELLRPLPYSAPDDLVAVTQVSEKYPAGHVLAPEFAAWRAESQTLSALAAWNNATYNITAIPEPDRVLGAQVSGSFLDMLGVRPAVGRGFTPGEDQAPPAQVALVSHTLWTNRLGSDTSWVGRTVLLNDREYVIAGVLPNGFRFPGPFQPDVLVPGGYSVPPNWAAPTLGQVNVIGRLRPGITGAAVASEVTTIQMAHSGDVPPRMANGLANRSSRVTPLAEHLSGASRTPLLFLMGAVMLVALIACVNVAALQLTRTLSRLSELTVRAALGSSKGRLMGLILNETVALAVVGGAIGLLVAAGLIAAWPRVGSRLVSVGTDVRMDPTVYAFAIGAALVVTLICGAVSALAVWRLDVHQFANAGTRSGGKTLGTTLRSVLVGAQVAMAFVLVFGLALLARSFMQVISIDTGVRSDGVMTLAVRLPESRYKGPATRQFANELLGRLQALPGVEAASVSNSLPFSPYSLGAALRATADTTEAPQTVPVIAVSPDYFNVLGIPLVSGEMLRHVDADKPQTALVNVTFARRFFGDASPIGKMVWWGTQGPVTIVGVVADVRHVRPEEAPQPEMFVPLAQSPSPALSIAVRTSGEPEAITGSVRTAVRGLDRELPIFRVSSLERRLGELSSARRLQLGLIAWFAAFGVLLAALGIYASISYHVNRRRREIGLRMALGAQPRQLRNSFLLNGLMVSSAGLVVGVLASVWLERYARSLLFATSPMDPISVAAAVMVVLGLGAGASYLPAAAAARTDPNRTLRYE